MHPYYVPPPIQLDYASNGIYQYRDPITGIIRSSKEGDSLESFIQGAERLSEHYHTHVELSDLVHFLIFEYPEQTENKALC